MPTTLTPQASAYILYGNVETGKIFPVQKNTIGAFIPSESLLSEIGKAIIADERLEADFDELKQQHARSYSHSDLYTYNLGGIDIDIAYRLYAELSYFNGEIDDFENIHVAVDSVHIWAQDGALDLAPEGDWFKSYVEQAINK